MNPKRHTILFTLFLLFSCSLLFAQNYILSNEVLVYSFETQKGKKLVLAKDKNNQYLIYRFGTATTIELEYPDTTKESWSKFTYSFYSRGGGIQNEGMDLNYVTFTNGNYQYVIYDTYYAVEDTSEIGIKITNLTNHKTTDIRGIYITKKGSLIDFRTNNLLKIEEE